MSIGKQPSHQPTLHQAHRPANPSNHSNGRHYDFHCRMGFCRMLQELERRLQQAPVKVSKSRAQAFVATLRESRRHTSSTRYTLEPLFEMCCLLYVPAAKVRPLPLGGCFAISPVFPSFAATLLKKNHKTQSEVPTAGTCAGAHSGRSTA